MAQAEQAYGNQFRDLGRFRRYEKRCYSSASTRAPDSPETARGLSPWDGRRSSSLAVPLSGLVYPRGHHGGRGVIASGLLDPAARARTLRPEAPEALVSEASRLDCGRAATDTPSKQERYRFSIPTAPLQERPQVMPRRPNTAQGVVAVSYRGVVPSTVAEATAGGSSSSTGLPVTDDDEPTQAATSWQRAEIPIALEASEYATAGHAPSPPVARPRSGVGRRKQAASSSTYSTTGLEYRETDLPAKRPADAALEELTEGPWRPQDWLAECDQAVTVDGPTATLAFVRCVRASTAKAIARRGYELPPAEPPSDYRGPTRKGPFVDLSSMMQGHPQMKWFSQRSIAKEPSQPGEAPRVVLFRDSPVDVALDFLRKDPHGHPVILVAEINAFDETGNPDLRGSTAMNPQDLLLRSDLTRFIEAAAHESRRCSNWALSDHLGSYTDPFLLWCSQVTIFRGSRAEGYPFLDKPVQVTVLLTAMASQRPPIQHVHFRRQGQTEWFQDTKEHSALLLRMDIIGRLAKCLDGQKPLLAMCVPGSGAEERQPLDALASCMKHWRKHYGANFLRVCLCCRGRGGGDKELEQRLGELMNAKPDRNGPKEMFMPIWQMTEEEEHEEGEAETALEGLISPYDRIMMPLKEAENGHTSWGGEALRRISCQPLSDSGVSDGGQDPDVDSSLADRQELESRDLFDTDLAEFKEKKTIHVGIVADTGSFTQKSRNTKKKVTLDVSLEFPMHGSLSSGSESSLTRESGGIPAPAELPVRNLGSLRRRGSDSTVGSAREPRSTGTRTTMRRRSASLNLDDRVRNLAHEGHSAKPEIQDKVQDWTDMRMQIPRKRRNSLRSTASVGGKSVTTIGGRSAVSLSLSHVLTDVSHYTTFSRSLRERGIDLAHSTASRHNAPSIRARKRSSLASFQTPESRREEKRGAQRHVVTDLQLDIRTEARQRLRQRAKTSVSEGAVPGFKPAPPPPPDEQEDEEEDGKSVTLDLPSLRQDLLRGDRMDFLAEAHHEAVMATCQLEDGAVKQYQKTAASRKRLETSIARIAGCLQSTFGARG